MMKKYYILFLFLIFNITVPIWAEEHGPGDVNIDYEIMDGSFEHGGGILAGTMASPTFPSIAFSNYSMGPAGMMFGKLYTPAMIMRNQDKLNLSKKQTETIKKEMRTFQSGIVDVQWDLNSATASLRKSLSQDKIDEAGTLKLVDTVLDAENK